MSSYNFTKQVGKTLTSIVSYESRPGRTQTGRPEFGRRFKSALTSNRLETGSGSSSPNVLGHNADLVCGIQHAC